MISGAHSILYSKDAVADRAFLREVLKLGHVDAGHGWLIFGLPPSEIAVHPDEDGGRQEIYFMCDDVDAFVDAMKKAGRPCTPPADQGWGTLTQVTLPSGAVVGVYQPRHPRPAPG